MWVKDLYLTPGGTSPGVVVIADGSNIVDWDGIVYSSIKGTKEASPCSDRGLCSSTTGVYFLHYICKPFVPVRINLILTSQ